MIDPQTLNLNSLPSVPLEKRNELPQIACIYLALDRNKVVQYVGKTTKLRSRWEAHHKGVDLAILGGIEIAYVEVSNKELLPAIEKALIKYFNPPLNIESKRLKNPTFRRIHPEPLSKKQIQVKIPESQYEAWMALPAEVRNSALREAIAKILQENYEAIAS